MMSRNSATRGASSLRRSSSSSHIPTLVKDSKPRAKSITRSDGRKTSLEQNLKRCSSSSNLLRATPLSTKNVRTPTQGKLSCAGSSGTKRHSALRSPFSVKKERPVNDKKWVAEQFSKIKKYLEEHPSCDQNVVNNLKPPTLNTFLYVCNLLLKELDPRIDFNSTNYKESIVAQLKILNYPGTVSNSLLKTVNTMHSWPQVISILSWLVDLLNFITRNTMDSEAVDKRGRLKNTIHDSLSERYVLFNRNEDDKSVNTKFAAEMNEILENDVHRFSELRSEVDSFQNIQQQTYTQLLESEKENGDLRKEIEEKRLEIEKFYDNDIVCEKQLKIEIRKQQERMQSIENKIIRIKNNISGLKETISKQPCTYGEKKSILENINGMKYTIELKKEKIEECLKIKSDFDFKLVEIKRKLEAEVYRLKTNVMQIAIINPDIKSLNLRDKGFHHRDFKDEINEFVKTEKILEDKISEDIASFRSYIDALKLENKELNVAIGTLLHQIEEYAISVNKLEQSIKFEQDYLKDVIAVAENREIEYVTEINHLRNKEPNLEELETEIEQLSDKHATAQTEVQKLQLDSLKFFLSINEIVNTNLKKIDQLRVNISEKIASAEQIQMENLENLFHHIDILDKEFENANK